MREIIQCQIGQCGNNVGTSIWDIIRKEHYIDKDGRYNGGHENTYLLDNIDVYWKEHGNRRYSTRAVLVDTSPDWVPGYQNSDMTRLFKPDNFIFGGS